LIIFEGIVNPNTMRTINGAAIPSSAAKSALLRTRLAQKFPTQPRDLFRTGLVAMDNLAPDDGLRCAAIHELLFESVSPPKSLALFMARSAQTAMGGVIVWSDPKRELNPIAFSAAGIDVRRLILLRPRNAEQEISALAECLRCKGVSATVTSLNRLSSIEARRLQLAAENGGGIGIFLRPETRKSSNNYAAATRWLVRPALESECFQSWIIELVHGHGGRIGESILLKVDRETNLVRASSVLANRPIETPQSRATA
jgi:protein ImuA